MSTYTAGQWRIGDAGTSIFGPKKEDGTLPETIATNIRRRENARLIVLAPDILEALATLTGHISALIAVSSDARRLQPGLEISLEEARAVMFKAGRI